MSRTPSLPSRGLCTLAVTAALLTSAVGQDLSRSPADLFDYSLAANGALILVALFFSVLFIPVVLVAFGITLIAIFKLLRLFRLRVTMLVLGFVRRSREWGLSFRWLVWVLCLIVCVPAGVLGVWSAASLVGAVHQRTTLYLTGGGCGLAIAFAFRALVARVLVGLKGRMAGGMMGGRMQFRNPFENQDL
jgi:hypothetical protein